MSTTGVPEPGRGTEESVSSRTLRPMRSPRTAYLLGAIVLAAATFLLGYYVAGARRPAAPTEEEEAPAPTAQIRYWTCSMHPQINMPQKGKCPICFMDLVPVYETARGGETEGPRLVLSKAARELAEIETSPVVYRPLHVTVRMVGKIEYDETRLAYVSAWVPGRIDKLYVNYVGLPVKKGEHLTYIYSPELRTAQEEFLIAHRHWLAAQTTHDEEEIASALAVKEATRKKLELWGILPAQIEQLEQKGRVDDHMTVYAPVGGTVISREAFEGQYFEAGGRLFTIADLSSVWAVLDAYEMDIDWLRYGQEVEFEADAFPGQTFKGRISFIQPVLNEMTRTVKVRADISNPGERLKPGIFVRARVEVTLDEAGHVKEPALGGKWICPMHPNVIKDGAGSCDICGMDLVEATSLGFGQPEVPDKMALSIPATAPLLTGTRAVVYVEERQGDEVEYTGRQVKLGPRAGDYYLVLSGLSEGEQVVTRGNFKIDAALQIQAKPSMMKPEGGVMPPGHQHGAPVPPPAPRAPAEPAAQAAAAPLPVLVAAPASTRPVVEAYLALADALAADDAAAAKQAIGQLTESLDEVEGPAPTGEAHHEFMRIVAALRDALPEAPPAEIGDQRVLLGALAGPIGEYVGAFGTGLKEPLYQVFCPMAFNRRGALWLQEGKDIRNPYLGQAMPKCGEVRQELPAVPAGAAP